MALKDWKKIKSYGLTKESFIYKKGYNKDNVNILRIDYVSGKKQYKYEIYAIGKYVSTVIEAFKTKSQALKYARAYMRKH